jgi:hypothetical protein
MLDDSADGNSGSSTNDESPQRAFRPMKVLKRPFGSVRDQRKKRTNVKSMILGKLEMRWVSAHARGWCDRSCAPLR